MAKFVEVPELDDDLKYASEQISKIAGDAINAIKELYLNRQNLPSTGGYQNSPIAVTAKREELRLPEEWKNCDHSRLREAPTPSKPPLTAPPQPTIDSTPRKEWVDESLNGTLL